MSQQDGCLGFNLEILYNQLLRGLYGINGIVIGVVYKFFDKFEHGIKENVE